MTYLRSLGLLVCVYGPLAAHAPPQRIASNDNRAPAGTLSNGVLALRMSVTHGMWHPDADDAPGTDALAFAEDGHAPSIPGPLIRVPVGTEIRTTVHNALTDSSIVVFGLSGGRGLSDSIRIRPGETRDVVTRASAAGTFLYRAMTSVRPPGVDARFGDDGMLGGALIVDPPGAKPDDRVFVIFQWIDSLRLKPRNADEGSELLTINGRTWPNTERLQYQLGDTIRWRVVNASFDAHPMHLHGAYFTVLSHGSIGTDSIYAADDRAQAVTERMAPLSTMEMQWVPLHAGNWLFHCHLNFHVMAHPSLTADAPHIIMQPATHSAMQPEMQTVMPNAMPGHQMGGLILGVSVRGHVALDARPRRQLRLVIEQYDSVPGDYLPRFSYETNNARQLTVPAVPIVVTQNEPIAITVVNRTSEPTSVHWHGLEIESYYDGVAGFDGDASRITPLVPPNDSFVVRMTPPRAGTFIYHSHFDDIRQQGGGLYGAFIVLPPGKKRDAEHERVIIIGEARDTGALKIDGVDHPTIPMQRGSQYRLRLINITLGSPNLVVALTRNGTVANWRLIARDGADLPARQTVSRPSRLQVTIGQTYDALFTPDQAGTYIFEVRSGKGKLLRSATVLVAEPSVSSSARRAKPPAAP